MLGKKIGVLGAGAFGSAMADAALRAGREVIIWARSPEVVEEINKKRQNHRYAAGHKFAEGIVATRSISEVYEASRLSVYACPSSAISQILEESRKYLESGQHIFLNTAKGLDLAANKLHSELYEEKFGSEIYQKTYQILSGPSFAQEILEQDPTCISFAGKDKEALDFSQKALGSPTFRPYTTDDVEGVEVGGAVKNVIAIVAGATEGMKLGSNAKAALINKGLGEITRLGLAYKAKAETFLGLSGMGDLVLTCTGKLSRNRSFGFYLGQGLNVEDAQKKVNSTIEGIHTTKAVYEIAQSKNLELPICNEIYQVIYQKKSLELAFRDLLERPFREEWLV